MENQIQITADDYIEMLMEQRNAAFNELAKQGAIIKHLQRQLNDGQTSSKSNGADTYASDQLSFSDLEPASPPQ